MGRSSRNEIRHHEQVACHTRSRVCTNTYIFVDTYVPAILSCTSRRDVSLFSIAGSIIMCAPLRPPRYLPGRFSPCLFLLFLLLLVHKWKCSARSPGAHNRRLRHKYFLWALNRALLRWAPINHGAQGGQVARPVPSSLSESLSRCETRLFQGMNFIKYMRRDIYWKSSA